MYLFKHRFIHLCKISLSRSPIEFQRVLQADMQLWLSLFRENRPDLYDCLQLQQKVIYTHTHTHTVLSHAPVHCQRPGENSISGMQKSYSLRKYKNTSFSTSAKSRVESISLTKSIIDFLTGLVCKVSREDKLPDE